MLIIEQRNVNIVILFSFPDGIIKTLLKTEPIPIKRIIGDNSFVISPQGENSSPKYNVHNSFEIDKKPKIEPIPMNNVIKRAMFRNTNVKL